MRDLEELRGHAGTGGGGRSLTPCSSASDTAGQVLDRLGVSPAATCAASLMPRTCTGGRGPFMTFAPSGVTNGDSLLLRAMEPRRRAEQK